MAEHAVRVRLPDFYDRISNRQIPSIDYTARQNDVLSARGFAFELRQIAAIIGKLGRKKRTDRAIRCRRPHINPKQASDACRAAQNRAGTSTGSRRPPLSRPSRISTGRGLPGPARRSAANRTHSAARPEKRSASQTGSSNLIQKSRSECAAAATTSRIPLPDTRPV